MAAVPTFEDLVERPELLQAIREMGFEEPTPVQVAAIPIALQARDLIAQAQTGTGKTAAFGLAALHRLRRSDRVEMLVLAPTRELAVQVRQELADLARHLPLRAVAIYGGQAISVQLERLRRGAEIVVGTPGRIIDLIKRGPLKLGGVRIVVLDEADRMLDMGFIEDIEWILAQTPKQRQTMLFSATIPEPVRALAQRYMRDPETVIISGESLTVPETEQVYLNVGRRNKLWALCRVLDGERPTLALVFCSTKQMVDRLTRDLRAYGYSADAIHGDLSQAARDHVMKRFREGKLRILVATDVAARGLDIDDVTHVVNYDIPENPEGYVHRIGRTGRMGRAGKAITFVTAEEAHLVRSIEGFAETRIARTEVPELAGRERVRKVLDFDEHADPFGMVRFTLSLGKVHGVTLVGILDLLARRAGIREPLVGHVEVGQEQTVIELHKSVCTKALDAFRNVEARGRHLELSMLEKY